MAGTPISDGESGEWGKCFRFPHEIAPSLKARRTSTLRRKWGNGERLYFFYSKKNIYIQEFPTPRFSIHTWSPPKICPISPIRVKYLVGSDLRNGVKVGVGEVFPLRGSEEPNSSLKRS